MMPIHQQENQKSLKCLYVSVILTKKQEFGRYWSCLLEGIILHVGDYIGELETSMHMKTKAKNKKKGKRNGLMHRLLHLQMTCIYNRYNRDLYYRNHVKIWKMLLPKSGMDCVT